MKRVLASFMGLVIPLVLIMPLESAGAGKHGTARAKHASAVKTVASTSRSARPTKAVTAHVKSAKKVESEPDFDNEGNPLIRSSAFLVQDVDSGEVLLEKNSSAALPIASITKLMTSMVVLDAHQGLTDTLEITEDDVDKLKGTGSRLQVGMRLTREELMRLALMASENRAASALARNYPGGMPAFLSAMNAKARLMGLVETHFFDGTGLNRNNVSSARDLATMVANASHYPLIREFSTSSEYSVKNQGGRLMTFHNTNALVSSPDWQIDVSKTGYISESGKCLVMQAWFGKKTLAIVLLDSWGRFTRLGDANRIRRWLETAMSHGKPSIVSMHGHGVPMVN